MMAFYDAFPKPGLHGAPVEIMRGCPHRCVFCCEPLVAGARVRYRPLPAIMADIEFLARHGVHKIYLISSELNPTDNTFILQLADRIAAFNKRLPADNQIEWFGANYLLRFTANDYERLHASGFTGGWFDITALDDENARAMRTPYRNMHLPAQLKAYAGFQRRRQEQQAKAKHGEEGSSAEAPHGVRWTMFLGNPATTLETIQRTLRFAHDEGLADLFDECFVNTHIRVFDYEAPDENTLAATFSVTPELDRIAYHELLPSFAYPPALLTTFGTEAEVTATLAHIGETYLSTGYRNTRNWPGFLRRHTTKPQLSGWLALLAEAGHLRSPSWAPIDLLFSAETKELPAGMLNAAEQLVNGLLEACRQIFPDALPALGLPSTAAALDLMSPYVLAQAVFSRYRSETELAAAARELARTHPLPTMPAFVAFCALALLYRFNVQFVPGVVTVFAPDGPTRPVR